MPANQQNIRSDEVQDIMSHVPHWMIRWGIMIIFLLITLLIFISWFIKYPDVIEGKVTITTSNPPVKLVTKTSGQIKYLYFEDKSLVKEGQTIAVIDDNFSDTAKKYLLNLIKSLEVDIEQQTFSVSFDNDSLFFGSLQPHYIEVKKSVQEYHYFLQNDPTDFEIENLEEQINNHYALKSVSHDQLKTVEKELAIAMQNFEIKKVLFEKQVISQVEFFEEEQKLIEVENTIGAYKKSEIESSITITNLKKELHNLKANHAKKSEEFLQSVKLSISNLKSELKNWGNNHLLVAPFDGQISYLKPIHQFDFVETGVPMFAVIPENQDYIGHIEVPKSGYGKIKPGQVVRVKVDNYPYQEFGQLNGKVTEISILPEEDKYRVTFKPDKGMISSYGKTLDYIPEMTGIADIITEDVRLISRIFSKFENVFDQ